MEQPKRKPTRLSAFDYSTPGAYFLTICAKQKKHLFSHIVGGGALDAPQNRLTQLGMIVRRYILSGNQAAGITVDKFVIMPNHIHLIVLVDETGGTSKAPSPTNAVIPHFVSTLKRFVNRDAGMDLFQRSYHDHIIRKESDYLKIWEYIDTNPAKWQEDCFYCEE